MCTKIDNTYNFVFNNELYSSGIDYCNMTMIAYFELRSAYFLRILGDISIRGNIYSGIIFPSLSPANIFQVNSRYTTVNK